MASSCECGFNGTPEELAIAGGVYHICPKCRRVICYGYRDNLLKQFGAHLGEKEIIYWHKVEDFQPDEDGDHRILVYCPEKHWVGEGWLGSDNKFYAWDLEDEIEIQVKATHWAYYPGGPNTTT